MAECLHQHISEFDNEQFCRTCSRAAADLVIELSEDGREHFQTERSEKAERLLAEERHATARRCAEMAEKKDHTCPLGVCHQTHQAREIVEAIRIEFGLREGR